VRDGYSIVDADRHVLEPLDLWTRYLPSELKGRAPRYESRPASAPSREGAARPSSKDTRPLFLTITVDNNPIYRKLPQRAQIELAAERERRRDAMAAGGDPEGHLKDLDQASIDVCFLFPTITHFMMGMDELDPALAAALARAYNEWLRDFCSRDPARLRGVGVVAPHNPPAMIDELERIAGYGFTAVTLRPNPIQGRLLSDAAYEPFWAECERLSIAVAVHEGSHACAPSAGADRFESRFALHACSHPIEQMMALLALIEGGVLERHPGLRVAFLEAGCGWLPYWLWRLDEIEWKNLAGEVAENVRVKPSEYFRRQCWIAMEPGEPYLPELLKYIGEDNLLFGTDFPHLDHDTGIVDEVMALEASLSAGSLQKILWDNAARFYRLDTRARGEP
jgi:predicted TIM-barrel fold metal-dependent hydrolase